MKKVKIFLWTVCILSLIALLNLTAAADSATEGKTGDCTWSLDGTVLTISGNGYMGNYGGQSDAPWGTSITKVVFDGKVRSIGKEAFYDCRSLTDITLPETVKEIGIGAFEKCTALERITVPSNVTSVDYRVFFGCTALTDITLSDKTKTIGYKAFSQCSSLTGVFLPNSVEEIEKGAFSGCSSLKTIALPSNLKLIAEWTFSECTALSSIAMSETITAIHTDAFRGCSALQSVYYRGKQEEKNQITYSPGNGKITEATWYYSSCVRTPEHTYDSDYHTKCSVCGYIRALEEELVTIEGVTYLIRPREEGGLATVIICDPEKSGVVTIPATVRGCVVEKIGDYAFENCKAVTQVLFSGGVSEIGEYAFSGCVALENITLQSGLRTIGVRAFMGCGSLTTVELPKGVGKIDSGAFSWCSKLSTINIPEGCTQIGNGILANCPRLTAVTVSPYNHFYCSVDGVLFNRNKTALICYPAGKTADHYAVPMDVEGIAEHAFSDCSNLSSITIPSSMSTIHDYAFEGCQKLSDVYYRGSAELYEAWVMIGIGNTLLRNWHFSSCIQAVTCTYDNACDTTCNVCGRTVSRAHRYETTLTPATLEQNGKKLVQCTVCKAVKTDEIILCPNNITLYTATFNYDGSTKTPSVVVKDANGKALVKGKDYSLTLPEKRINAGTYTATVTMMGNYSGTKELNFEIAPQKQENCTIKLSATDYVFDGKCKTPSVVVKNMAGKVLVQDTDYTLTYATGRINAGTYQVLVAMKGNYTGTKSLSFKITPQKAENVAGNLSTTSYTYNGSAKTPSVTVKDTAGKVLKKGTDYTVTYASGRIKAGTYKVTVKMKGNYTGTKTLTFKINPVSVSKCTAKLAGTTYTYNGKAKTPAVTIKYAGKTLKKGTDYTVTYASGRIKAGTYKVTVKMQGNYTGTKTLSFKIKPVSVSKCTAKLAGTSYTYNGKAKTPAVTIKYAGKTLKKGTDYTVTYASGRKNVGTYKVTVKMKGNYSGTKTLTFKINPAKTTVSKLTVGKKSLTVAITKKTAQVTGYQVQYSTSKSFSGEKAKNTTSTKLTLKGLTAKKTYYVRVRTYKTVGGVKYYSAWSAYKSVKTK